MKVFTHNFNPSSNSGPNKFTRDLFRRLVKEKNISLVSQSDSDIEFCLIQQQQSKVKPLVLRLDGIWFNSEQDYRSQNTPIRFAYNNADAVIFQSDFNKKLTESWFGPHKNGIVIHNAADDEIFSNSDVISFSNGIKWPWGKDREIWSCASSWRPHKRLRENVRYFLEFSPENAIFAIAGNVQDEQELKECLNLSDRIHYLGELTYQGLVCLYLKSSTFVHLAYLDHCPNVVVDAQAAGCRIICSSTGGTSEIVDTGSMVIEKEWDFKPCKLYSPPPLDFSNLKSIDQIYNNTSKFENCTEKYYNSFKKVLEWD